MGKLGCVLARSSLFYGRRRARDISEIRPMLGSNEQIFGVTEQIPGTERRLNRVLLSRSWDFIRNCTIDAAERMLFVLTPAQLLKKNRKIDGCRTRKLFGAEKRGTSLAGRCINVIIRNACAAFAWCAVIPLQNIRKPSDRHHLSANHRAFYLARIRPKASSPFNEGGNSCRA